jgi:hypothetical protein
MGGKREIKVSLGLKDREAAKQLIPDHTKAAHALLDQAKREKAAANAPASKPIPQKRKSLEQLDRERKRWEFEQEQAELSSDALFAADMEMIELEPIMDALEAGQETEASLSDIARAGRLLVQHEREKADADKQALIARMYARYGEKGRASESQNQAVDCQSATGKSLFLDGDILDRWATERGVVPKGKDTHKAVAEWFNDRVGKKSVELGRGLITHCTTASHR